MSKAMPKQLHNFFKECFEMPCRSLSATLSHCHHTKKDAPCDAFSRNYEPSYVNVMNLSYCKTCHLLNLQGKLNFYFISF